MSELVRNDISSESLCTVIENCTDHQSKLKPSISPINIENDTFIDNNECSDYNRLEILENTTEDNDEETVNGTLYNTSNSDRENRDTTPEKSIKPSLKPRTKLKKSVSFDPNDEKILKFISGEPIVDQKNPFKGSNNSLGNSTKKKRTPPPVPTKRSTLSIRKTVTQQLREREREKEKEKERIKNEVNNRKKNLNNGNATNVSSPDEFITTEEVLKQSKYVKTYIKNPDPYFVYDPAILARLKFEELRELSEKKPPKKVKLTSQTRERLRDLKNKQTPDVAKAKIPTFKKCSKPNYPELSDIKVKVGTDSDGNYFNPDEVTKNAKKFDERVKKLHISSEDDIDEIDEPLTKSESSDEVTVNGNISNSIKSLENLPAATNGMNGENIEEINGNGTFTNTIKSKEFQEYLQKKGLTLIPKKIPSGAQPIYTNGMPKSNNHITFKTPESVQISIDAMDSPQNNKKPSVFQRLLQNSIFTSRRRTTPKETVPIPKTVYDTNMKVRSNGNLKTTSPIKRVVLERQSFHGRPRAGNLLSTNEVNDLKSQMERSRKSFASGDDLSVSISSALTNAEYDTDNGHSVNTTELRSRPIAKPPRRTLSKEPLANSQMLRLMEQQAPILKPAAQKPSVFNNSLQLVPREYLEITEQQANTNPNFRRTLERQSLVPKRTTTPINDKRQMFGRSSSMDRNEILRRTAARGLQNRTRSASDTHKVPTNSKENLQEPFTLRNGPKITSTPKRDSDEDKTQMSDRKMTLSTKSPSEVYVDQQEWERLKAIKERTDRELYYRMLQQQQKRLDSENIYEHLPHNQVYLIQPHSMRQSEALPENNFIRGSPQRNTFSGVIRNRQMKIIDGKPVMATGGQSQMIIHPMAGDNKKITDQSGRSQSVLDGMTIGSSNGFRRGYESDSETPVILRRKPSDTLNGLEPRRIGGILTREEILQKVKEFCRKSINRTPTNQHHQIQVIYEKEPNSTDLSPVSYASVETHQRPMSRMYAAPQVPQRMQSLPQQFIPIGHEVLKEQTVVTPSPIYAHVIKRSSIQSNQSELYDSPQRPYVIRPDSEGQTVYMGRRTMPRPDSAFAPTQYVVVDSDKLTPAQVVNYHQQGGIYAQPQYVRPHQLQPMPGTYGYITVREPLPPQHQLRQRLHDGRCTPLILDRSSQQVSQIYWTPQHQRLQQHAGLLPVQISPRYTLPKQQYHPVTTVSKMEPTVMNRVPNIDAIPNRMENIPNRQQQQQQQQQKQISGLTMHTHTPPPSIQLQQKIHQQRPVGVSFDERNTQHPYEWESGSEAGEVQRIMEMEHQRNSGEFKKSTILGNLKTKLSRLVSNSKR